MTAGQSQGEFLLYQTEDAQTRIQVRLADDGLWLTQHQLAELFQSSSQNITQHRVPADVAQAKVEAAYALYQQQLKALPSRVEQDFEGAIAKPVKQIEKSRKPARLPKKDKGKEV